LQFDLKRVLINFFEKAKAESVVDFLGAADDCVCEDINLHIFSFVR